MINDRHERERCCAEIKAGEWDDFCGAIVIVEVSTDPADDPDALDRLQRTMCSRRDSDGWR